MSRRASLPGADELFRSTGPQPTTAPPPVDASGGQRPPGTPTAPAAPRREAAERAVDQRAVEQRAVEERAVVERAVDERDVVERAVATGVSAAARAAEDDGSERRRSTPRRVRYTSDRRPTGRERHEEKITVYVSAEELLDLEHARLALRGDHGLAVDRGRIVREALAVVLIDLAAKGPGSILVRRLRDG